MVRTSDFQFENVGSSPANPKLSLRNQNIYHFLLVNPPHVLSFHFLFASIITPLISPNLNLLFQPDTLTSKKNLLKNSYVILAWFYYMNSIQSPKIGIRFFVLPTRAQVYTLTKAPIAHKSNSKEQYKFVFYLLRVSFTSCAFVENELNSVNQGLLFLLLTKGVLPFFSSNLLILKNIQIKVQLRDTKYFNYNT